VHRESNLITVQQDATYSDFYISVGSSTCFGCWHPSSGASTAMITASGIGHLTFSTFSLVFVRHQYVRSFVVFHIFCSTW